MSAGVWYLPAPSSIITTATTTSPRALLLALELLHLSPACSFSLLQLLYPLGLLDAGLSWHSLSASLNDQFMQLAEAASHVVVLFTGVVGLDHDIIRLRCMIPAGQDRRM